MKYKNIKGTQLNSSVIIMGGDGFGAAINEKDSFKLLDKYMELGGNHIDTANIYGYPTQESEKTIGKWLKSSGKRPIIATKGGHPNPQTMDISRLSEKELREDLDKSLENLGIECVDLYWLHRDDAKLPVSGIIETLNKFIKEGKIREIGCSNWTSDRIRTANNYAVEHGLKGFAASQIKWSFAQTADKYEEDSTLVAMTKEQYPFYEEGNVAVMAYASQAKGFFTKYAEGGESNLSEKAKQRYMSPENMKKFELIRRIAKENNVSVSTVVLEYLINQPFDTFPIVGCKNTKQLEDSLAAADSEIASWDIRLLVEAGNA
ncbi:MAG: aldo/keto reductase [Bacillota bacterium]|nr:aldo/keto reductase [Bacillota bacterium]